MNITKSQFKTKKAKNEMKKSIEKFGATKAGKKNTSGLW